MPPFGMAGGMAPVPSYSGSGRVEVINVSAYDPKERQRSGRGFSEYDVSALRANGAQGLIARAGKGGALDTKCANFLAAADAQGMQLGVYYRLQNHVSAVRQADQFVARARSLAASRDWRTGSLLLCVDIDAQSSLSTIITVIQRVRALTGVLPVIYLENSTHLKRLLSSADPGAKALLRQCPYWIALYSHESGASADYPAPGSPEGLLRQYGVWSQWALWQYGGVDWQGGRSRGKVYRHGRYQFSPWFGNLDRPVERNIFNGSPASMAGMWARHGIPLR
jgi:GH25 family lysozyme M1 (1,4-beta-N-acetylmuramidase)